MAFTTDYPISADMQSDLPEWLREYTSSSSPSSEDWFNSPMEPTLDFNLDLDLNLLDPSLAPPQPERQSTSAPTPSSSSSGPSIHSSISQTHPTHQPPETPNPSQLPTGPFTCTHPQCACTRTFRRASELSKHIARITRPFPCSSCRTRPFSTRHDLARHRREVHKEDDAGKKVAGLVCPVKLCMRSKRAFGRRENLVSHVRRVHGEGVLGAETGTTAGGVGKLGGENRGACGELEERVGALLREREGLVGRVGEIDAQVEALRMSIGLLKE